MPKQRDESKPMTPQQKASKKYDESVYHVRLRVPKEWEEILKDSFQKIDKSWYYKWDALRSEDKHNSTYSPEPDTLKALYYSGRDKSGNLLFSLNAFIQDCIIERCPELGCRTRVEILANYLTDEEIATFRKTLDFSPYTKYQSRADYPDRKSTP